MIVCFVCNGAPDRDCVVNNGHHAGTHCECGRTTVHESYDQGDHRNYVIVNVFLQRPPEDDMDDPGPFLTWNVSTHRFWNFDRDSVMDENRARGAERVGPGTLRDFVASLRESAREWHVQKVIDS